MLIRDVLCFVVEPIPIRDGEAAHAKHYQTLSDIPDFEKRLKKNIGEPYQVQAWKVSQNGEKLAKPILIQAGTQPIIRLEDWFQQCVNRYDHIFEGKAWNRAKPRPKKGGEDVAALMALILEQGQQIKEMAKEIAGMQASGGTDPEQADDEEADREPETNLSSYTKEELVDLARDRYGIDLSMGLNKPTMIATIQARATE